MRGLFHHPRTKDILDPEDIFSAFGFSKSREAYTNSSSIERQDASPPGQQRVTAVDLLQVDNLVDLQGARISNHDPAIDSGEVNSVSANQAVVR